MTRLTRDVRAGRVDSIEGAIGKRGSRGSGGRSSSPSYLLEVGDRMFVVSRGAYQAAPDAGYVRLYFGCGETT